MKILQLCNKPPYPSVDGGCIAMKNISLGLIENNVDLKVITISTEKHPFEIDKFPSDFVANTNVEGVFIDTRVNIIDAFSALVTADSYNVSRFFSADFDKKLKEELQNNCYDFVHLESLFLTPFIGTIGNYSDAKIVLRSHNLEHLIWERLANLEGNKAKKIYLNHLSKKLKKYEKNVLNDVDGIAAISYEDTKRYEGFSCKVPLVTIPFAIDLKKYKPVYNSVNKGIKLFHIGSMDWNPNIEAINWFLDDILPILNMDKLQLHLAGKNMPDYIKKMNCSGIVIHGMVDSAIDFMGSHDVMIVPLLSGSGMRIKIIEAMAMGKTVISTKVGLEGIAAEHKKNVLIANTAAEFKDMINLLSSKPELMNEIGEKARCFVEENHDNTKVMGNLIAFYKSL
jgi:glycosyltransferase involved in cell wall biosynthesis